MQHALGAWQVAGAFGFSLELLPLIDEEEEGAKEMNPHTDTVPTAVEVWPALDTAMKGLAAYLIYEGIPKPCLTCGTVAETRFGHCFACVSATSTFVDYREEKK